MRGVCLFLHALNSDSTTKCCSFPRSTADALDIQVFLPWEGFPDVAAKSCPEIFCIPLHCVYMFIMFILFMVTSMSGVCFAACVFVCFAFFVVVVVFFFVEEHKTDIFWCGFYASHFPGEQLLPPRNFVLIFISLGGSQRYRFDVICPFSKKPQNFQLICP